jgi:hypothetical protein
MKLIKIALVTGALAAGVASATALAAQSGGPEYHPSPPSHAKANGFYCKGKSKKHVKGEKGTEFSRCVTALAKAKSDDTLSPGQACKGKSKEHVKGEKGTEFSRCVTAVAHLRRDERRAERESARLSVAHPTGPPEGAGRPEGTPPAGAGAGPPEYVPAGPKEGLPSQAKAYGRRCKGKSKKHVKGEKGTPFSRCVKAAAQQRKEEREGEA